LTMADILYRKDTINNLGLHDSIALKIGQQLKDSFIIALSYYRLGQMLLAINQYAKALDFYNKALSTKFEKDQSEFTAVTYNDIGYAHGMLGEMDRQIDWYLKAMRIYEKIDEPWGAAQTLSNISTSYIDLNKPEGAVLYAKKAIALREKLGDINGLAISYNNLSQIYLNADSLEQAIKCQQLGLKYAEQSGSKARLAHAYLSMSLLLNKQGKNIEALEYEKKVISMLQQTGDEVMLSRRYIAVAILYSTLKDSLNALEYFQKGYDLAHSLNNKFNLRDLFLNKAIFYKERKDYYNAYENFKKYILYRDSIMNQETSARIADIQTKYETDRKDNQISKLFVDQKIKLLEIEKQKTAIARNIFESQKNENEIELLSKTKELQETRIKQQDQELEKQLLLAKNKEQELQLSKQEKELQQKQLQNQRQFRNLMIGGIVLLLLAVAALFNRFQLKKKLEQQQALLDMRNAIARDLHDEIGSTLTSINILSQVSKNNLEKDQQKTSTLLQKITEQSHQMQQSMSDIVWAVKSDNDRIENIMVRMREYLGHTIESKNVDIHFDVEEEVLGQYLSMQQRKDFFLVFKEAVNNAAKYASCSKMEISIRRNNGHIALQVKDNGKGFDVNAVSSSSGLKNMQGRAKALNGNLTVLSTPGQGTSIQLQVPAT
jgi:two-component system sensor histidine kinase UhpB